MVLLMAKIYYRPRVQSKVSGGEKPQGVKSRGRRCRLPRVPSQDVRSHRSRENTCEMLPTREVCWRLSTQGSFWGWLHGHLLPGSPKLQTPRWKGAQQEPHCWYRLFRQVTHSCQRGMVGRGHSWNPSPDTSQGPASQAGLAKNRRSQDENGCSPVEEQTGSSPAVSWKC